MKKTTLRNVIISLELISLSVFAISFVLGNPITPINAVCIAFDSFILGYFVNEKK